MNAETQARPSTAADKFRVINQVTEAGLTNLQKGIQRDVVGELDALQRHVDEIEKIKPNEVQAKARMRVLETKIEDLKAMDDENEKGLANAVFALNARLEGLGEEYTKIESTSPQEAALVKASEDAIKEATSAVEAAKQAWFFRGMRTATAEAEVGRLKLALEETKKRVEGMRRTRIMNAKMEQSLQEFMRLVDKTKTLIKQRIVTVGNQLTIISARKLKALSAKQEAADALEVLSAEFEDAKNRLQTEEEVLGTMTAGSKEHTDQGVKVSDIKRQLADAETARNNALVVFQSKEKFANIHEVYEQSFIQMKGTLTMWQSALESDTEERVIVFRARLEGMKAHADQVAARNLDRLGAKIDQDSVESVATYGAAAQRAAMDRIEEMPGRIRDTRKVAAAQLESQTLIMHRMARALDDFRNNYGIDPMETNFKHSYDETAQPTPSAA